MNPLGSSSGEQPPNESLLYTAEERHELVQLQLRVARANAIAAENAAAAAPAAARAGGVIEVKDSASESISIPKVQSVMDLLPQFARKKLVKIFKNTFDSRNLPLLRLNIQIRDTPEDRLGV